MKILLAGDTHGDSAWVRHCLQVAANYGCDRIVQLGDFGFWPHYETGVRFIEHTSKAAARAGIDFYWLDGNHENHDEISALVKGADRWRSEQPFIQQKPNLFYIPRGSTWNWDGVNFMALGGAYSIDAKYRTPGSSWWSGELISDRDVDYALQQSSELDVHVFLSHDCPIGTTPWQPDATEDRKKDAWPQSLANRKRLRMVVDAVRPKELFHGHYHLRYDKMITVGTPPTSPLLVHGLGRDGDTAGSTFVFDTEFFRNRYKLERTSG